MELSNDEVRFLNENIVLKDYFYDLLLNIKNSNKTKIIICKNSYERRFVHILANSLGLCHSRYGDWSDFFKKYRDYQENVNKYDGLEHYKIVGVKVSTKPLHLSRKDKKHQNQKNRRLK
jgi:hypothetical protein